jgi:hypothetical protein
MEAARRIEVPERAAAEFSSRDVSQGDAANAFLQPRPQAVHGRTCGKGAEERYEKDNRAQEWSIHVQGFTKHPAKLLKHENNNWICIICGNRRPASIVAPPFLHKIVANDNHSHNNEPSSREADLVQSIRTSRIACVADIRAGT